MQVREGRGHKFNLFERVRGLGSVLVCPRNMGNKGEVGVKDCPSSSTRRKPTHLAILDLLRADPVLIWFTSLGMEEELEAGISNVTSSAYLRAKLPGLTHIRPLMILPLFPPSASILCTHTPPISSILTIHSLSLYRLTLIHSYTYSKSLPCTCELFLPCLLFTYFQ